jgi:hypothetical protein
MKNKMNIWFLLSQAFWQKIFAFFVVVFAFFEPIKILFFVTTFLILLNLVTSIIKNIKLHKDEEMKTSGWFGRAMMKFQKMVGNAAIRWFLYIMFISAVFAFEVAIFGTCIWLVNLAAGFLLLLELSHCAKNMDIITNETIFTRIIDKVNEIFKKKTNQQ